MNITLKDLKDKEQKTKVILDSEIRKQKFESVEEMLGYIVTEVEISKTDNEIGKYKQDVLANLKQWQQAREDAKGKILVDVEELRLRCEEQQETVNKIRSTVNSTQHRIDMNSEKQSNIILKRGDLEKSDREYTICKRLYDLVRGSTSKGKITLEQYIQAAGFDGIIAAANRRLLPMSDGQYELYRQESSIGKKSNNFLDLEVLDNYTGHRRPVGSLSGGESFKASLSLALGLSDTVSSNLGGIQMDALFVDEGFGTLDHKSMDSAMDALVNLSGNNKLVGIISHREELVESIPQQIKVKNQKREARSQWKQEFNSYLLNNEISEKVITEYTMSNDTFTQLQEGLKTAYIDGTAAANLAYKPAFVSNNPEEGKKVISVIEDELMKCDQFQISVAFITMGGITPLLQTLKELEKRQIPGQILTTNYLNFSEPRALKKLQELSNVTLKMYDVDRADQGFHTKGYIFKKEEIYRIIIGSSNITSAALTKNKEWNTKIVSTEQGEIAIEIVKEFYQLWDSKYALFYDDFYENYKQKYEIIKKQREIAKRDEISSTEKYKLEPNSMQVGFITNLRRIVDAGENRALLISATGTGKTYASAFAMRELGFKRVLFLVHRSTLAKQALTSFRKVFEDKKSMGIVGAGYSDYEADYIFAMVETLHKADNLRKFDPEEFDCIVLDEAHHSPANTYQKVMEYFKPKLFLGMTATPDKRDDGDASRNVYELFHYQIAYEIRLQQAMEEDLLCPFHYFGISDISMITDEQAKARNISEEYFGRLTGDERVRHVIEQARYYGYSGDRVKGLIFCSRNRECEELSAKFNNLGYRTVALSGKNTDREREAAFERLAMNEADATDEMKPLDYIFSVDILNEGVDIVEVNQVIMLRPTQSPIVFIQQLGRGLRKAENKEYVVILDFIGNYNNNFMIPVALSGDRTYNADTIRKYVISGNNTIPGASTVHFDEIAKEKIFNSIDKIRGMKSIIRESYISLKIELDEFPCCMTSMSRERLIRW